MIEFSDYDNLSYTGGRLSAASTLSKKLLREPAIQVTATKFLPVEHLLFINYSCLMSW
jgi:hypothetical protein